MSSGAGYLDVNGKKLTIVPDHFIGAVDSAVLTKAGVRFSCWALLNPAKSSKGLLPSEILILADGVLVQACALNARRADIAAKFGEGALLSGLKLDLDLGKIPRLLDPNFDFFAFDGQNSVTKLNYFGPTNKIDAIRIRSGSDFFRIIQTPSTRVQDSSAILYASMHMLARFPDDFVISAAAICVIGYRIIGNEVDDDAVRALFETHVSRLLEIRPNIPRGLYLRWHTSMRLIAGYVAYQGGKRDEALQHFCEIPKFFEDLRSWPQALTNILLGVYISGYLLFESGKHSAAIEYWERAQETLRYGASVSQFNNFYAYGELGNAIQVARECHIAALVAKAGGPLHDVSIAPDGTGIEIHNVPGPIGRLSAEYRALTGEADYVAPYRGVRNR